MNSRVTRRDCLRYGFGTASVLAVGNAIPAFLAQSAAAMDANAKGDHVLVVLELDGGNDGLNTVVPYADEEYYRYRRRLGVPKNKVLKLNEHVGLHPSLTNFNALLDDQQLAIVQSVGYPNPTRSHFRSRNIWYTGQLDATNSTQGWLSRYFDATTATGTVDAPAIMVGDPVSQSLTGGMFHAPSVDRLERLERRLGVPDEANPEAQLQYLDRIMAQPQGKPDSMLRYVQQSQIISFASSRKLSELLKLIRRQEVAQYPDSELGRRLGLIGALIRAQLKTRVYYLRFGDFDTHSKQAINHQVLLSQLAAAVRAFLDDLNSTGDVDRVLLLAFSEFGRRLKENFQGGTDHGTAGPVFLAGSAVRPGVHGPAPNLHDLDDSGDPKFAIDFRGVYATVLEKWFGCSSESVLHSKWDTFAIL